MSLLTKASLVLTPNAIKSNKVYSIIPSNGNGDLTFTRDTAATQVNSSGNVENVLTTIPRLNYDSVGGCPSLLLEPQRMNLLNYSEQFDQSYWNKQRCTITANSTNSPNGTSTADTLVGNSIAGSNYFFSAQSATINVLTVFSVYIKPINITSVALVSFTQAGTSVFSLVGSGSVISNTGICSGGLIESLPNGWYRISTIITPTSTAINNIGISTSGLGIVGDCFYIWGAQLEQGAYPTSYIPTTTSSVTRNADTISINNIYTNNLITSDGGTWFIEINNNIGYIRDATSNFFIGTTSNGNTNTSFGIRNSTSASARLTLYKRELGTITASTPITTENAKILVKWNNSTADFFINGAKIVANIPHTATIMDFLMGDGKDSTKYIKSMLLFPTPLTDADCINLTTL